MIDSIELRVINDRILDTYLFTPYWECKGAAAEKIFSRDCVIELPYAPPGMPQSFPRQKRRLLLHWLDRTLHSWSRHDVVKYATLNPGRFWVESRTKATVAWGGKAERPFNCTHIEFVQIEDGKIVALKTWSDPLAYYTAAGVNLPPFYMAGKSKKADPIKVAPLQDPPKLPEEIAAKRLACFNWYLRPEFEEGEVDQPATGYQLHPDHHYSLPFMPTGMQRVGDRDNEITVNSWIKETLVEWHQNKDFVRDLFVDPDVSIVESNGNWGKVKWDPSGGTSGYYNDYVILVRIRDFCVLEFKEYLNPVPHLIAANTLFPVFPFFY